MGTTQRAKNSSKDAKAAAVAGDVPAQMPRQKKPDYVGALMGVVCCACAFVLLFGQRQKPLTFAEQVSGEWSLQAVRLAPTEQLGKKETFDAALKLDTTGLGAGKAHGELMRDESVRGVAVETGTKFGRITIEGDEGMIGYEIDFRHLTNAAAAGGSSRQVLAGVYRWDEKVIGRTEASFEDGSMFLTFIPDEAGEPGLTVVGTRTVVGKQKNEVMDKVVIGALVFVMVVVVTFIRTALKPH